MEKKFRKSADRPVAGVVGGIAEYFGWNKRKARIIALLLVVITGFFPLVLLYVIALFLMKEA